MIAFASGPPENRRNKRLTTPMQAFFAGRLHRVLDWSLGGLRLAVRPGELAEGQCLAMLLVIPGMQPLAARGCLAWQARGQAGIKFVGLSEITWERLQRYTLHPADLVPAESQELSAR